MRRLLARGSARVDPTSSRSCIHARCVGVGDVHVLDAHGAAVRVAQAAEDLAHALGTLPPGESPRRVDAIQVPQRQAVGREVEVRVALAGRRERVDVGHEVPARAVRVDGSSDRATLSMSSSWVVEMSWTQRTGS